MKLFEVVVPTKNPTPSQKKTGEKSKNKGSGAVALILAFIAISKA